MRAKNGIPGAVLLALISLCINPGWAENKIPDNFVDLQKVIPSVILDIRYHDDHNFVGTKVDGYQAPPNASLPGQLPTPS